MTIGYPDWWKGGRWELERLLRDVFTNPANKSAQDITGLRVERMFTDVEGMEDWLKAGNGFLFVHRRGGRLNKENRRDESIAELAGLTRSADESNTLMEYVCTVLEEVGDDGMTVHRTTPHRSGLSTTFMTVPGEVVGPQLIPERMRDDRWVPATWQIHADRPRGLPDYRESLGLD